MIRYKCVYFIIRNGGINILNLKKILDEMSLEIKEVEVKVVGKIENVENSRKGLIENISNSIGDKGGVYVFYFENDIDDNFNTAWENHTEVNRKVPILNGFSAESKSTLYVGKLNSNVRHRIATHIYGIKKENENKGTSTNSSLRLNKFFESNKGNNYRIKCKVFIFDEQRKPYYYDMLEGLLKIYKKPLVGDKKRPKDEVDKRL